MNNRKYYIYCSFILIFFSFQTTDVCNSKTLKDAVKNELSPYQYDLSKLTKFAYKNKPYVKEIEVDLFWGEKYKLIFNTSGTSKPVVISLYNKDKEHKNRKLLYTTKNEDPNKKIYTFEYSKARHIYIDYEIPADSSGTNTSGCIMFVLGYK